MAPMSTTAAAGPGAAPPWTPDPPPYGTTGTPWAVRYASAAATSSVERGRTTHRGGGGSRPTSLLHEDERPGVEAPRREDLGRVETWASPSRERRAAISSSTGGAGRPRAVSLAVLLLSDRTPCSRPATSTSRPRSNSVSLSNVVMNVAMGARCGTSADGASRPRSAG